MSNRKHSLSGPMGHITRHVSRLCGTDFVNSRAKFTKPAKPIVETSKQKY